MKIEKIYFDMDGVLADFDRGVKEICHQEPADQSVRDPERDNILWKAVKEAGHFYDMLEPLPGGIEMFMSMWEKYGERCEILSGIPKPRRGVVTAEEDKRSWAKRYLPEGLKVNIVQREEKKDYVKGPGYILIDDYAKNIKEWVAAGGIGIHHVSAEKTMKEIAEIDMIAENIKSIEKRIDAACARAGRNREDVRLIAVSKTKPIEMIYEAMDAGMTDFGENYVQELCGKLETFAAAEVREHGSEAADKFFAEDICNQTSGCDAFQAATDRNLKNDIRWHMIGHLQSNKAKYVTGKVFLIHSVDSYKLAAAIEKEAAKAGNVQDILIEINIGDEASKSGIDRSEAIELVKQISELKHVHICGLMCIPPVSDDPEASRPYFRAIREISDEIRSLNLPEVDMRELSMGMTGDFEAAIEEGATYIRVGTAIFGARDYSKK